VAALYFVLSPFLTAYQMRSAAEQRDVIIDKVVDAYVTPAGITQLMQGEVPEEASTGDGSTSEPHERPFEGARYRHDAWDKFSVTLVGRRVGPRLVSIHGVRQQQGAWEGERALTSAAAVRASRARTSQARREPGAGE
jgi:hypothetical protein